MKTKTKFFWGGVLALALGLGAIGVVGNLSQAQEVGATETTTTYAYGNNPKFGGFTFSSFTDKDTYYLVPADASCLISKTGVLGSSGLNVDKAQQIVVTINHATYGSGTNPSASTFSFYNNTTGTGTAVASTSGGKIATSSSFVDATYTFAANAFSGDDLCIKVTKPGKQIRFKSFAIKFTASTAPAKTFTSLAVSGAPTKTSYVNGNTFDPTGLVVTASFDDSSTENVSSDTVWTPAPLSTGTTSVTGTYSHGGVTKTVACSGLTVVAESLVSMKITTAAQTEYATGDALDFSALVVTGTYDNGTTKVITSECTCSPANGSILSVGETTVTVSHEISLLHIEGKKAEFALALTHRDYLGALMALGYKREMIGDIVVVGKEAYAYVFTSIASEIQKNLLSVGAMRVKVSVLAPQDIEVSPSFTERLINVASLRLDAIIGEVYHLDRNSSKEAILHQEVSVSGVFTDQASLLLKGNERITYKGHERSDIDCLRLFIANKA